MKRKGAESLDLGVTILTAGCHFDGRLYCKGASRVGGRIEGELVSEGMLVIEEGALIVANVKAEEVIIQGKLKGRLDATKRVELAPTAKVEGDIVTPSLVVNEGAMFNGSTSMGASAADEISDSSDTTPKLESVSSDDVADIRI